MALRGALPAFPLDTVLQLLAATTKTGVLEVRSAAGDGTLEITRGRLTSARYGDDSGPAALGPIFAVEEGDFEFRDLSATGVADLEGELERVLENAAEERDRYRAVREVISDDHVRFALSARAAERGEVRLGPTEWRTLLTVNGARDVGDIAREIGMSRLATAGLLAGLVRAGMVDTLEAAPAAEAPAETPPAYARLLPPMQPLAPTVSGEPVELTGTLPDFPLETIVQLLAATKKTGRLEVRGGSEGYVLGMDDGRLVSAAWADEAGELALGASFTLVSGEFSYVPMAVAPAADLEGDLDDLLDVAARTRDVIAANRALIPSERALFRLSERAAQLQPQITLTPEQWRALLAVNGERDVALIAQQLRMRRLPTLVLLADLVRGGLIDVLPPPEPGTEAAPPDRELTWPFVERRRVSWPPPAPSEEPPATAAAAELESVGPVEPIEPVEKAEPPVAEAPPEEAAFQEEPTAAGPPTGQAEHPLAETPLDHEPTTDHRLAALSGLFGPAEAAPSPAGWEPPPTDAEAAAAAATAEAFASRRQEEPEAEAPEAEIDPRLAAFGAPPVEERPVEPESTWSWQPEPEPPSAPAWEPAPTTEWAGPSWDQPAEAAAAGTTSAEAPEEIDPRLAAFSTPSPAVEQAAPEAPADELTWPEETYRRAGEVAPAPFAPAPNQEAPPAEAPAPKKKGGLFGLFGARREPIPARSSLARTSAGRLALFANELIDAFNSGRYGKARVEDRMLGLLMRVDEQAEPIDRPIPVASERVDVAAVDDGAVEEAQAVPYLASLVRQVYDDAEHVLGKDKARRGFREVRDRLFGKDLTLLRAPAVAARMPKV